MVFGSNQFFLSKLSVQVSVCTFFVFALFVFGFVQFLILGWILGVDMCRFFVIAIGVSDWVRGCYSLCFRF